MTATARRSLIGELPSKLCTLRSRTTARCVRGVIVNFGLLVRLSHSISNTLDSVYKHICADYNGFCDTAGSHGRRSCGNNSRSDG